MQPNMIEAERSLGEVVFNPLTSTADGTLQLIGLLRNATRLLEHRYAVQISERHDPAPVPAKHANGQAEPKNKGGRPRGTGRKQKAAAAVQPAMFPPTPLAAAPDPAG